MKQICNFCKRSDVTDFSTCRYCGAKYGTSPTNAFKDYLTKKVVAVGTAALCVIGYIAFRTAFKTFLSNVENSSSEAVINYNANERRNEALAPIGKEILLSHRPRVLEFFATGSGPCQGYGPLIEDARNRYAGIDFYRYDVDDPTNRKLKESLGVQEIPVTCFFDRNGNEVDEQTGSLQQEILDGYLNKIAR